MLYDPRWQKDRKLGPISLRSFIAFLESKPADETYKYYDPQNCALGQFMGAHGFRGSDRYIDLGIDGYLEDWQLAFRAIVGQKPLTFGAALERARAALAAI